MPGRQAKIITPTMLKRTLAHVSRSDMRERDRAIILLSAKAGLRAAEIANLEWSMVIEAKGKVGRGITVEDRIAKRRAGRRIPLHPDLRWALIDLWRTSQGVGPVIRSSRGGAMKPNSIVNWFVALYAELGFAGCSSHSGRRSFITTAARNVHRVGGSLRDVQLLAGHGSMSVTQGYIDGDSDAQRRLVCLV